MKPRISEMDLPNYWWLDETFAISSSEGLVGKYDEAM